MTIREYLKALDELVCIMYYLEIVNHQIGPVHTQEK